jgi:hypothetical protein
VVVAPAGAINLTVEGKSGCRLEHLETSVISVEPEEVCRFSITPQENAAAMASGRRRLTRWFAKGNQVPKASPLCDNGR